MAVIAMESSNSMDHLFQTTSALHTYFPEDPDAYYAEQEALLLDELGLQRESPPRAAPPPPSGFTQSAQVRVRRHPPPPTANL